jgi:hypothetical protein
VVSFYNILFTGLPIFLVAAFDQVSVWLGVERMTLNPIPLLTRADVFL